MITAFEIKSEDRFIEFFNMSDAPSLRAQDVSQKSDASWMATDESGQALARCSVWWTHTPHLEGHRVGLIGHYASTNRAASRLVLQQACEQLALHGCTIAVGPVDGSTWQRYRLVTERDNVPPFFLEPDNPDEWTSEFIDTGFFSLATYSSAINDDLNRRDSRAGQAQMRLKSAGVEIRALRDDDFAGELSRIYKVAEVSFRKNFLYSPLSEDAFSAQYALIRNFIRPELCLIAEFNSRPVGFIFALPDALQMARGETVDTVIIKTVAVLPERAYAGLGALLVNQCQEIARNLGYKKAIHALMHDMNNSRNISGRYARVIRRYTLFARKLESLSA